jgi:LPS sulfotransferase NodH
MITKIQQLKAPTDETVSIEVIPSGMTLTLKTTLKSPDYELETVQDIPFSLPNVDTKVKIYLINDTVDPIEVVYDGATPTGELVMDICSFRLTPLDVDLANVDITVLEVI